MFVLVGLVLPHAAAATLTILPCDQDRIAALLGPYGVERDIVPGWRCTGIAISDVIDITLQRGQDRIDLVLHDPDWNGETVYRSRNYRMTVAAAPTVAAAEVAQVTSAAAKIIAGNDQSSFWYETAYSPFPIERGRRCVSSRSVFAIALLVAALAAVAGSGLLVADTATTHRGESLPKLLPSEWMAVIALTVIALVGYFIPSYWRFTSYGIRSADMGIYAHAFWNAWQGHGLFNSPEGLDHLSSHASPGLYLLLPFYALAPHPLTLLALNDLALVSGAIPAYLIARRRFGVMASALCAVVYLVNPALSSLNYDVHEITFALPLFLWTLLFLQCRRAGPMLLCLSLALLFKENVGITACFLGIYVIVVQRRVRLGVVVMLLGLLWVIGGITLIVPYFGGSHANKTMIRYAALGQSWADLLLSPLRRPAAFFAVIFSPATITYLEQVLSPFGFLPLVSPTELLLATPTFAENILDGYGDLRSGQFHYEALLLPVLYVAFVGGVARLSAFAPRPTVAQTALLAVIVVSQPLYRSAGRGFLLDVNGDPAHTEIDTILAQIPPGASVISPQHIQPHLSDRRVSAYFNHDSDLTGDYPPFDYAVLPTAVQPPQTIYEPVWQGSSYSLFRQKHDAGRLARPSRRRYAPPQGERRGGRRTNPFVLGSSARSVSQPKPYHGAFLTL